MLRPNLSEALGASVERKDGIPRISVKRNDSFACFGFALADRQRFLHEVNVLPAQLLDLAAAHGGIESEGRSPSRILPLGTESRRLEQFQLSFIAEGPAYALAQGQRLDLIREQVPALCFLEHSANDVQFAIDRGIRDAVRLPLAHVGKDWSQ